MTERNREDPGKAGEPMIRLRGIAKNYRLGKTLVHALRGVDLDVSAGEFTALAGPSGSGKTTLLNIAGCLDKPDAGSIVLNGEDVTGRPTHALSDLRNRSFGFVFQTYNLIAVLSAYENVEFPLVLAGVPKGERRDRSEELLERVGLADHARHRPNQLSGGQRQRVAIARALVTRPMAVLADEPTANLDSRTGREIIDLMAELNEERGGTFLFASHDPQILDTARRVLTLTDGSLDPSEAGSPVLMLTSTQGATS